MSNRGRHKKRVKVYHISRYSTSWISKVLDDETISKILDHQFNQTGIRDLTVFEKNHSAGRIEKGFNWRDTPEGHTFWQEIMFKIYDSEYYRK